VSTLVWIRVAVRLAVAGVLAVAAGGKFTADPGIVTTFQQLEMGTVGRLLIGSLEAAVALGLLVPALAPTAAVLGWGVMTGALIAHVTRLGFSGEAAIMALTAAATWSGCLLLLVLDRERVPLLGSAFARREPQDP